MRRTLFSFRKRFPGWGKSLISTFNISPAGTFCPGGKSLGCPSFGWHGALHGRAAGLPLPALPGSRA